MHHVEILADKQLYLTNAVCAPKLQGGLYVKEGKKKKVQLLSYYYVCVCKCVGRGCLRAHARFSDPPAEFCIPDPSVENLNIEECVHDTALCLTAHLSVRPQTPRPQLLDPYCNCSPLPQTSALLSLV